MNENSSIIIIIGRLVGQQNNDLSDNFSCSIRLIRHKMVEVAPRLNWFINWAYNAISRNLPHNYSWKKEHQQLQQWNSWINANYSIENFTFSTNRAKRNGERIGLHVSLMLNCRNQFNSMLGLTYLLKYNISMNFSENGAKLQLFFCRFTILNCLKKMFNDDSMMIIIMASAEM